MPDVTNGPAMTLNEHASETAHVLLSAIATLADHARSFSLDHEQYESLVALNQALSVVAGLIDGEPNPLLPAMRLRWGAQQNDAPV